MIVTNTSPIIALGRLGVLGLLAKCFKQVIIPEGVYQETTIRKGSPEAIALDKAVKEKWVVVESVTVNPFLLTDKLGSGEKEAISLAAKRKAMLLLDDDTAKAYASVLGVQAHGTLYVIYLSVLKNFVSQAAAIEILDAMIANGFYISTDVYSKFVSNINSLK